MRAGLNTNGRPSQEQVTLLNIKDATPTYGSYGIGPRQNIYTLKKLVLDPTKNNAFVSPTSKYNFETRYPGEFGDHIGYNENIERAAVLKAGLQYHHMPIGNIICHLAYN